MTSIPESSRTTDSEDLSSKLKTLIGKLSAMEYAAILIVGFSLLLRVFFLGSYNLLGEEAYYWNYAQHLDFGYLDHPPMVALLIKLATAILGTHEFGVRISSLLCWVLAAFFSYKLTNLISKGAGLYAVMLMAILPFFFLHSLVMTPDQPLILCWSATLYCLYRSLILNESKYWYAAGIWLGLGLLSKYTIVLIGPATLLYLCIVPSARLWFLRKEPYICALIAALLFTPVIYWNATHEWISFVFQSTRRLEADYFFSFHHFIGLLVFFLMPPGLVGLWALLKSNTLNTPGIHDKTKRFLQIFTLVPFLFFGVISLSHEIKFNWIGPGLLALIPWLAMLIQHETSKSRLSFRNSWLITAVLLLFCYSFMLIVITFGAPELVYDKVFKKFIAWDDLTQQVDSVAHRIETRTGVTPVIVPLDLYATSSELSFYQAKFLAHGETQKHYPIMGRHIFGTESLMYRYWSHNHNLAGKPLIIISNSIDDFDDFKLKKQVIEKSPLRAIWSHSPVQGAQVGLYYYQVVEMRGN